MILCLVIHILVFQINLRHDFVSIDLYTSFSNNNEFQSLKMDLIIQNIYNFKAQTKYMHLKDSLISIQKYIPVVVYIGKYRLVVIYKYNT